MSTKLGTNVKIMLDGLALYGELGNTLTASAGAIEVSSKASGLESNFEPGRMNETGSCTSRETSDGSSIAFGYIKAKAAMLAGNKVVVVITEFDSDGLPVDDAAMHTGLAVLTNVSLENPDNAPLALSIDFQFDGKLNDEVNPATDFLAFSLAEQTGPATINTGAHTVAIEVAAGTAVTALVATFTLSGLATAVVGSTAQVSGTTANSFTSAVTYAITAGDGTT